MPPITIESGIPITPPRRKYAEVVDAITALDIGQSILVSTLTIQKLAYIRHRLDKQLNRKTVSRQTTQGVRLWRTR